MIEIHLNLNSPLAQECVKYYSHQFKFSYLRQIGLALQYKKDDMNLTDFSSQTHLNVIWQSFTRTAFASTEVKNGILLPKLF